MLDGLCGKGILPFVVLPEFGDICAEFDKRGILYEITPFYLAIYPLINNLTGLKLRDIILYVPRIIRVLLTNYRANRKMIAIAFKYCPDLIHTNVGPLHNGHYIGKKLKVPHVWHVREYQDLDFKMSPLFSMDSFINKLHFSNNHPIAITKGISKHFDLDKNGRVISNGIFKIGYTQLISEKSPYFLFAGRLEPNKGIDKLLKAFCEFSKTNNELMLYVAGDTNDLIFKDRLTNMVNEDTLEQRVKFLGMRDNIADLMANATALIVPSLHEGFGRITVEAMFNGCLVIGNNTGGTKEILEEERLGILYSGHDELVAAMLRVANNGIKYYFELIMRAQQRATTLYSQEQNVNAVYDYYRGIL
jgi:glycosyltransferase involved in cell wall biosynthesis